VTVDAIVAPQLEGDLEGGGWQRADAARRYVWAQVGEASAVAGGSELGV
jgi:hypothetical protein